MHKFRDKNDKTVEKNLNQNKIIDWYNTWHQFYFSTVIFQIVKSLLSRFTNNLEFVTFNPELYGNYF